MKLNKPFKGPKVNRVVKYFVMSDLVFFAGWGFVAPIFSIFIVEEVRGGTLVTVGISASVYWIARSLVQPFMAKYIDKKEGEKDDLYVLMLGLLFAGITAFSFIFVSTLFWLYILQVAHGVAMGMYSTPWSTIFSRHLDKNRQAFDWSIDKSAVGFTVAVTSFVGGILANNFGFDAVFIVAGTLSVISAGIIFLVPDLVLPQPKDGVTHIQMRRHRPPTTH